MNVSFVLSTYINVLCIILHNINIIGHGTFWANIPQYTRESTASYETLTSCYSEEYLTHFLASKIAPKCIWSDSNAYVWFHYEPFNCLGIWVPIISPKLGKNWENLRKSNSNWKMSSICSYFAHILHTVTIMSKVRKNIYFLSMCKVKRDSFTLFKMDY